MNKIIKPSVVAEIHRDICARQKCEYLDKLNYNDPCASCPNGHWGAYTMLGCEGSMPKITLKPRRPRIATLPSKTINMMKPGDIFSLIIYKLTKQIPGPNCSCRNRQHQMNQWGWWGCWRNRKEIINWLQIEAAKRGHKIEGNEILSLLKAAFKEMKQKN